MPPDGSSGAPDRRPIVPTKIGEPAISVCFSRVRPASFFHPDRGPKGTLRGFTGGYT
jgi:hypothetical protein